MSIAKYIKFPDGQIHFKCCDDNIAPVVHCRIRGFDDIGKLYLLKEWLDRSNVDMTYSVLKIYWLAGARWDRIISEQESFDLKVFATLINHLEFSKVEILDPHSYASLAAINNAVSMDYAEKLYRKFNFNNHYLVIPDAGAEKRGAEFMNWHKKYGAIQCLKTRKDGGVKVDVYCTKDLKTFGMTDLLIVDDICDGGATFLSIAEKLQELKARSLRLMVTHGIFSKVFSELSKYFSHIYTTNSFQDFSHLEVESIGDVVTTYKVGESTTLYVYKILNPEENINECFIID